MEPDTPISSLSATTSHSLLARVKARDGTAWRRLVQLYSPMVYGWARRAGVPPHDAMDVVQNVFLAVASDIHRFRHNQYGDTFRGWLRSICRNRVLDHFRDRRRQAAAVGGTTAQRRFQELPSAEAVAVCDEPSDDGESERLRLRHRALTLLRGHFEDRVWEAILRTVVHGDRPVDVAADLGLAVSTVYRARFRVMALLQSEFEGL